MKFDPNATPPCFSNTEEQILIERNARVRLKIVGTRVDATEIVGSFIAFRAVGTDSTCCDLLVRDRLDGQDFSCHMLGADYSYTGTIREDYLGLIQA